MCSPKVFAGWTAASAAVSVIVALLGIIVTTWKVETTVDCGIFGNKQSTDASTADDVNTALTYMGLPALIGGILGIIGGSLGAFAGRKQKKNLACGAAVLLTLACILQVLALATAVFLSGVLNDFCESYQCSATTGCTSFLAGLDGTCCYQDKLMCEGDYDQICGFQALQTALTVCAALGFLLTAGGCGSAWGAGCCCPWKANEKQSSEPPQKAVEDPQKAVEDPTPGVAPNAVDCEVPEADPAATVPRSFVVQTN
eukprot:gnl/TRDRNA2_/TRDRNA2_104406_c0_seq1.p1 gnl/TRDRNA2_/TRDRNA2_104406_c0~~gnl/TRDRNA2_/TRDRNA2_104406_c0_seq1.p1  ORF type:complete len:256 (+),score=39.77 gnl/TRDRNA2_/TRDRNA2_104406_c0_seq1:75-842(+)